MDTNNIFARYTDAETFAKITDYSCITQMWNESVANYQDSVAIVDGESYTYGQLDAMVSSFRALLSKKGVKPGDIVGMYLPNCVEFAKAYLAITTMGACAVLLPPHLDNMTVFGCSMKFGMKALVYSKALEEKLDIVKAKNPNLPLVEGSESCEESAPGVICPGPSVCTVLFTGGTTGKSKGAKLTNQSVMEGVKNGCYGIKEIFNQRYLLVLPLTHVFGLIRNLLTALRTGSAMFICRNNKDMFRDIAMFKPTIMVMVPALAEMALNLSKQFGKNMLGADMQTIICGAAAVAPYLVTEYDKLGIKLLPGYGLTESSNLVSGNPEALRKPDSVGYIYPGIDYKIVDGELWLKGTTMMAGYVGDEENGIAYSEDGYFKTGDLVRIDEEGFLYITGRAKEIIVLSTGENISPAELESYFYALDEIQDCLVYADNVGGREVLAVEILPRAVTVKQMGIADVESHMKEKVAQVNEKLPAFQRISKVVIRDCDFVRSPSMKIVRGQNGQK